VTVDELIAKITLYRIPHSTEDEMQHNISLILTDNKEAFVNGDAGLLIMSLRSAVGLDGLQDASKIVVFGELDWSPGVHEQVKGRLNRDGQKEQVTSIFLTTNNGTDPLMVDILGLKASQASGIMNPTGNEILQLTSDEDRIKLLAREILGRK
jgi:SNF2 family DNA or RNA helicase